MMKRLMGLLALLALWPAAADSAPTDSVPARKRVAVVLSGGGAFGAVHVGALKVLEQAGMPIDMVVGTSMGSIVGAMYSVGYSSGDIAAMFRTMDWADLFLETDDPCHLSLAERDIQRTYLYKRDFYVRGNVDPQPGGVLRGNKVEATFERYLYGYTDSIDFTRDLPRQFACVAADLFTDRPVTLTSGSLARSIRASMSIPGVFTPVSMGDMELVDGGTKNNFAADVARQMGADIVIGVKFNRQLDSVKYYRKIIDVVERSGGSDVSHRSRENEKYCDLVIKVPVRGFTSGSFKRAALDSLMRRGEEAARAKLDSILLLKSLAVGDINRDYGLHLRDLADADSAASDPKGLIDNNRPNTLEAAVGLRFDSEELLAAQLGGRWFLPGKRRSELDLTLRLGLRSMLRLNYEFEPKPFGALGARYEIWYKYSDLFTRGKRSDNLSYLHQRADVKLLGVSLVNFDCEIGLGWDHYHHFSRLWNEHSQLSLARNEHYFNYHARLRYDSEDDHYFPTRGALGEIRYDYCTDNFAGWKGHSGFSALMATFRTAIPLLPSTRLQPSLQGRLLFGDNLPVMAGNVVGGPSHNKLFAQQLQVAGFGAAELAGDKFVSAALRLQQRFAGRHHLLLEGSVSEQHDELDRLFDATPLFGAGLSYFYNSTIAGPLGATLGWNSHSKRVNFVLSLGFDF